MYYEEREYNGRIFYRTNPTGRWQVKKVIARQNADNLTKYKPEECLLDTSVTEGIKPSIPVAIALEVDLIIEGMMI